MFDAFRTLQDATQLWARRLFKFSLLYLALMCAIMVIDRVLPRFIA